MPPSWLHEPNIEKDAFVPYGAIRRRRRRLKAAQHRLGEIKDFKYRLRALKYQRHNALLKTSAVPLQSRSVVDFFKDLQGKIGLPVSSAAFPLRIPEHYVGSLDLNSFLDLVSGGGELSIPRILKEIPDLSKIRGLRFAFDSLADYLRGEKILPRDEEIVGETKKITTNLVAAPLKAILDNVSKRGIVAPIGTADLVISITDKGIVYKGAKIHTQESYTQAIKEESSLSGSRLLKRSENIPVRIPELLRRLGSFLLGDRIKTLNERGLLQAVKSSLASKDALNADGVSKVLDKVLSAQESMAFRSYKTGILNLARVLLHHLSYGDVLGNIRQGKPLSKDEQSIYKFGTGRDHILLRGNDFYTQIVDVVHSSSSEVVLRSTIIFKEGKFLPAVDALLKKIKPEHAIKERELEISGNLDHLSRIRASEIKGALLDAKASLIPDSLKSGSTKTSLTVSYEKTSRATLLRVDIQEDGKFSEVGLESPISDQMIHMLESGKISYQVLKEQRKKRNEEQNRNQVLLRKKLLVPRFLRFGSLDNILRLTEDFQDDGLATIRARSYMHFKGHNGDRLSLHLSLTLVLSDEKKPHELATAIASFLNVLSQAGSLSSRGLSTPEKDISIFRERYKPSSRGVGSKLKNVEMEKAISEVSEIVCILHNVREAYGGMSDHNVSVDVLNRHPFVVRGSFFEAGLAAPSKTGKMFYVCGYHLENMSREKGGKERVSVDEIKEEVLTKASLPEKTSDRFFVEQEILSKLIPKYKEHLGEDI